MHNFEKPPLDELAHYGVKGMKWGVRKSEDGSRPVAKRLDESRFGQLAKKNAARYNNKKLGDGTTGLDPVTTAYLAVGAAVLARKAHLQITDSGRREQRANRGVPWKQNKDLVGPKSVDQIMTKVVKPINAKPPFGERGTQMNCRRCTFAYEMRRRGMDVHATTSVRATGQTNAGLKKATNKFDNNKDGKQESIWGQKKIETTTSNGWVLKSPEERSKAIFDALGKNPDGARGELGVSWTLGGGHSMAWEVVRGKPVIFDAQSSVVYKSPKDFSEFAKITGDAAYTRLDNKTLNDDFIRRWATNVD